MFVLLTQLLVTVKHQFSPLLCIMICHQSSKIKFLRNVKISTIHRHSYISIVQDFLSSHPFPTNSQENRDRKMNVPVSSVQSNTLYHKRNLEEYLSPVEETPAPSVTSPQMQTLSFESNGFLVSEVYFFSFSE